MKPLRYKYQTIEFGDNDIHLRTLKDKQQFSDKDKKRRFRNIKCNLVFIWSCLAI